MKILGRHSLFSGEDEIVEYSSSFYGAVPPLPPYRPKQWKLLQKMIDGSAAALGGNEEGMLHFWDSE
jgi:hypothetical protein